MRQGEWTRSGKRRSPGGKRLFAVILALALVFSLLPGTALAAATSVTVGGVVLDGTTDKTYWKNGDTETTGATGNADDYNAWFDVATGTLTLKDANITGAIIAIDNGGIKGYNCGIFCYSDDLTIKLEGANTVTADVPTSSGSCAIYCAFRLTINGKGSLVAQSTTPGTVSYGVRSSSRGVEIEGVTVTAIGGKATTSDGSCGIFGPNITIKDSTVTATGGMAAGASYGLRVTTGWVSTGEIDIINSTVTAKTTSSATGTKQAMYRAPVLTGVQAQGSTASDGSNPVPYVATDNNNYMWVKTEPAVGFSSLTANGSATETTTALTLTFDQDVSGLAADDITLTGATKGTLTKVPGATGQYTLTISDITVASGETVTVAVAKTGFAFAPASRTVPVHVYTPPTITITPSGSAVFPQGAATGNAVFTVDSNLSGFNAVDHFDFATLDGARLDLGSPSGPGTPGTPGADGSAETGSIVLTIYQAKLNTLAVGDHPLVVTLQDAFRGRTVSGVIRVLGPGGAGGADPDIPKTGDGSLPLLWAGLLVLAAGGLIALRRKRKA